MAGPFVPGVLIGLILRRLRLFVCGLARGGGAPVGRGLGVALLGCRHHAVGKTIAAGGEAVARACLLICGPLLFRADTTDH